MKMALIGGAGFLGSRFAAIPRDPSIEVSIYDKVLGDHQHLDITKPEHFSKLPRDIDAVINLAAEHRDDVRPKSLYDLVNVEGSRHLCNWCTECGINTIIFTSSVAVYGFAEEGTDESGAINYFNDYGRTKYLAEEIYRDWYSEDPENRNLTIIRPTVIFGEANRGNVFTLLRQIASGKFLMFGDGQNKKSMAYVENVAEVLQYALSLKGYNLYNYIDKPDINMNTLVQTTRQVLFGKSNIGPRLPAWLGILGGYGFDLLSFFMRRNLPVSSIRVKKFLGTTAFNTSIAETGFQPSVPLEEGLQRTLRYEFLEDNSSKRTFLSE